MHYRESKESPGTTSTNGTRRKGRPPGWLSRAWELIDNIKAVFTIVRVMLGHGKEADEMEDANIALAAQQIRAAMLMIKDPVARGLLSGALGSIQQAVVWDGIHDEWVEDAMSANEHGMAHTNDLRAGLEEGRS